MKRGPYSCHSPAGEPHGYNRLVLFLCSQILAVTVITLHEDGKPGMGSQSELIVPYGKYCNGE